METLVRHRAGQIKRQLLVQTQQAGYTIRILSRSGTDQPGVQVFRWNPQAVIAQKGPALEGVRDALEGADLLVNLAGASLVDGRLGRAHKQLILQSRVDATRALTPRTPSDRPM